MTKEINYIELSTQLDEILLKLQSDQLDVAEAIKLYEQGMTITTQLEEYLQTAENKITKIKASFEK